MKIKRILAIVAAAMLLCGALADPVDTEYLVDMTSEEVQRLEQRLAELGYLSGEPNEIYDADTRLAIESFQQANGLEVSGAADVTTLKRLYSEEALSRQDYLRRFANAYANMTPMEKGSVSNDVLLMQRRLKEYGYFSGECDGVYGDATLRAVESFQMVNGLSVTGVADGATLMRLMADAPITWPAYLSEMSAAVGDTGLNVYALQRRLRQMGYFQGECTASFGDLTQQAVLRFQKDSGLEQTGAADPATWVAIYSGAAAALRREGALQQGDRGEAVQRMQLRLNALGYYSREINGEFDAATATALRLFQIAADAAPTGLGDDDTLARLAEETAPSMADEAVRRAYQQRLESADARTQAALADAATALLGTAFGAADDGLYPGFTFAQYVCCAAGLPVTAPEDLIHMASQQVEAAGAIEPGDIVAFQTVTGDSITIRLTIGAGDGKVIYATDNGGWVVLGFMDQIERSNVYRWDAQASFGE